MALRLLHKITPTVLKVTKTGNYLFINNLQTTIFSLTNKTERTLQALFTLNIQKYNAYKMKSNNRQIKTRVSLFEMAMYDYYIVEFRERTWRDYLLQNWQRAYPALFETKQDAKEAEKEFIAILNNP